MWRLLIGIVGIIFLFASDVIFLVMSGIGLQYYSDDVLFSGCDHINRKVMYGCGIGVALLLIFFLLWYVGVTTFPVHYAVTIPTFIVCSALYITYAIPSTPKKCTDHLGSLWIRRSNESNIDYQIEHKCCGWDKANHYGMENCPFDFESGCSKIVRRYLDPRINSLFVSGILCMSLFIVSIVMTQLLVFLTDEEDLLAAMEI